ncbi:calcium-binding protein [Crocosphaera watsonii]|uniref:calcium-binding protein n=1 Tax=Crocosphaera watsonii TaxID=263511 RepID=UPI00090819B1|nr:hypothetical protein [Crocosphaera watsonii]
MKTLRGLTVIENEDGASFTGTFTVDGNIPPVAFDADGNYVAGGLSVFLDVKEVFELANQFDTFIETNLTFGSSEAAASQPNIFELILFEETSELTITIFDDIIEEEPFTYNFELVDNLEGSDYIVNPDANTGSFVLEDGLPGSPGVGPDVGVSVTESELFEGDEFTVNFTVEGDDLPTPDNPLTVLVDSGVFGAIGEFVIFDEEGNEAVEFEGIAGFPEVNGASASGFLVDLIAPTASLTLEVFDDGPGEGLETFDFELANGELYEVDPDNAGVTLNIDDTAPALVPNFGSLDGDTIEGVGSNELTFGGAGDDLIDTVGGTGGNRLYGQSGDDTFILGSDDRALGGAGDDRFFLLGGDNTITGGQDMDQFWIANADIPPAANTITDFESGEDVIGVAALDIGFDDLGITQQGDDTLISLGNDELAKLLGVTASDLTAADFAFADSVTI